METVTLRGLLTVGVLLLLVVIPGATSAQDVLEKVETSDLDNFWAVCAALPAAATAEDTLRLIQEQYLDRASRPFRKFIRLRDFTAEQYLDNFRRYPRFWGSLRRSMDALPAKLGKLGEVLTAYERELPDFDPPAICFAVGNMRTGGTVGKDLVLMGAEIALADATTEISELSAWLTNAIQEQSDVLALLAHEIIHTQQRKKRYDLVIGVLSEGVADYLARTISGYQYNSRMYDYGDAHFCELRREFLDDVAKHPEDYRRWLYQGDRSGDRPADLGYYLGARIAERWMDQQPDRRAALRELLDMRNYHRIFAESGFAEMDCE